MNTTDFLNIATAICPERDMTVFEGERRTFAEVNDRVSRLAGALSRLGVKKGDRVGILQVNCSQYVEAYFASAKLGAIFVPLNFRTKTEEISYMISNAGSKLLFLGGRAMGALDVPPQIVAAHEAEAMLPNTTKHCFLGPKNGYLAKQIIKL